MARRPVRIRSFATALGGPLLLLGCEPSALHEAVDCKASQGIDSLGVSPHFTEGYLFVVDDTQGLRAVDERVKDALAQAVSHIVNPATHLVVNGERTLARPDDPLQGSGYRNLTFAFLLAGSPDWSETCAAAHAAHGGALLTSPEHPSGLFHWTPTEWPDLSNGALALERLVLDVRSTLDRFAFSDCEAAEPLEALFELLAAPQVGATISMQRSMLANQFTHVVFVTGSDDSSGPGTSLHPEERYVNLFRAPSLCLDAPTLSDTACSAPVENPTRLVAPEVLSGPQIDTGYCRPFEPGSSRAPGDSRLERALYPAARAHPICVAALDAPDDRRFLPPLFQPAPSWKSESNPRCWNVPLSTWRAPTSAEDRPRCRVFEVPSQGCSCDGSHLIARPLDAVPREIRESSRFPAAASCACEIQELTGPALVACQNEPDDSVWTRPAGWCVVNAQRWLGTREVVGGCSEHPGGTFRFVGRDVPGAGARAFAVCQDEACVPAAPAATPESY